MVFLVVLAVIGLIGIVSTAHAVLTDGYRQVDARQGVAARAHSERNF